MVGETEVNDPNLAHNPVFFLDVLDQDVVELEVAVDYAQIMHTLDRVNELPHDLFES